MTSFGLVPTIPTDHLAGGIDYPGDGTMLLLADQPTLEAEAQKDA
jgi:hypothetical protein